MRTTVSKTPKCYLGGAFVRSESGRVAPLRDAKGEFIAHIPQCTRKDLRNAVEAAAKAGPGWSGRSAYNRGQILYRLAEMMEPRKAELADAVRATGGTAAAAAREVAAAIDRTVYYAGWTDKFMPLLGGANPVSTPHFNFTLAGPSGVIGVIAPGSVPLLGLFSLLLPAVAAGNTVVALASETNPLPAILAGEMFATSDFPGGVVNLLTGSRNDMLPTFASHAHIRGLIAVADEKEHAALESGAAEDMKRVHIIPAANGYDWFSPSAQGLVEIRRHVDFKTVWHPVGA